MNHYANAEVNNSNLRKMTLFRSLVNPEMSNAAGITIAQEIEPKTPKWKCSRIDLSTLIPYTSSSHRFRALTGPYGP